MKWLAGNEYHPYEYRFFEGNNFPSLLTHETFTAKLNPSFRVWLRFDQLLKTDQIGDEERLQLAIRLCVKEIDAGFPGLTLTNGLFWFYSCDTIDRAWILDLPGRKNHKTVLEKLVKEQKTKNTPMSLFWDSTAIWGAFKAAYGIDLFNDDLHWWAFQALLAELPDTCGLARMITQRTKDPKDVDSKERGQFVVKQHLVSVPAGNILDGNTPQTEKKRVDDLRKRRKI